MSESSPTAVFYGSSKAEQAKVPKKESKIVSGVRKAVDSWLERIGPKSIEKHFVKAHENVLATLNSDQRKEVFAKEAEVWQKAGKRWGIAATVIDTALMATGLGMTIYGHNNPTDMLYSATFLTYLLTPNRFKNHVAKFIQAKLEPPNVPLANLYAPLGGLLNNIRNEQKYEKIGNRITLIPTLGALSILITSGPGHWLAHLAAGGKEQFGKMKAKANNYVDSGKAAEHVAKIGNAVGKAATETAKYVAEHPDEIRKTVETVNRVKRQNAESAQKIAEAKQKAADLALEKEYQDWIAHHPDKAYYEQSGQPYPSKAEYVAKKNEEEAKRKANKEAEIRGMAKDSPKH